MHTDMNRDQSHAGAPGGEVSAEQDVTATAPGQLRVIKRNGKVVAYDDDKITVAITKAFLAVEGGTAAASSRIHDTVDRLTEQVSATFKRRMPSGGTIHIEEIQDQVELALMRNGEHKVARDYVLYRDQQARKRAERAEPVVRRGRRARAVRRGRVDQVEIDLGLEIHLLHGRHALNSSRGASFFHAQSIEAPQNARDGLEF